MEASSSSSKGGGGAGGGGGGNVSTLGCPALHTSSRASSASQNGIKVLKVTGRDGLFGSETGQVGFWVASTHRGGIVLKNNGARLLLTRQGGFVFLPADQELDALVLEQGYVCLCVFVSRDCLNDRRPALVAHAGV